MILPHEHQTAIHKGWLSQVDDDDFCMREVSKLAHPMWIKGLPKSPGALESSHASETVAKTPAQASSLSLAASK